MKLTAHLQPSSLASAFIAFTILIALGSELRAQVLPAQGCPKAHCDQANRGFINLPVPAPEGGAQVVWVGEGLVGEDAGSNIGLGCSSNGTFAVCSYNGEDTTPGVLDNNAVAYDYHGMRIWTSGDDIRRSAYTSAPMIFGDGPTADTIVVDAYRAIRFNTDSSWDWNTPLNPGGPAGGYGGTPISPVITNSGIVILATSNGPPGQLKGRIYAIDNNDPIGPIVATKYIKYAPTDTGSFDTHKSAAVDGNRVYISMQHRSSDGQLDDRAWLVALDVNASAPNPDDRLVVAWHYQFSTGFDAGGDGSKSSPIVMKIGPGGTSPVVLFDGWYHEGDPTQAVPQIFGVRDDGTTFTVLWHQAPSTQTFAAFLADPRGSPTLNDPYSFWHVQMNNKFIRRRYADTGNFMQAFDIDAIIGAPSGDYVPCSAMTIAGSASDPIMIVAARDSQGIENSYLVAIRLNTPPHTLPSKVWAVDVQQTQSLYIPTGQFPLVSDGTNTRVIFTAIGSGIKAIGVPD